MALTPYYDQDGITIYHGDCREILPQLEPVDLLLTDPPYGLKAARKEAFGNGVVRHATGLAAGKVVRKRDYGDASWDDTPVDQELLDMAIRGSRWQIIFGGNYFHLGPARCYLVWDKLRGDTYYADAELAWTNLDTTVRVIRYKWNGFLKEKPEARTHPTQKPLEVMKWALRQAPSDPQSVLDPFMGVGTTLVAAKNVGLKCIGIEQEERYCEIGVKRLAQGVLPL